MGLWTVILPVETRENLVQILGEHGIQCKLGPMDELGCQRLICSDAKSYVPLKCRESRVSGVGGKKLGRILVLTLADPRPAYWKKLRLDFRLLRKIETILAPIQEKIRHDLDEAEARDDSSARHRSERQPIWKK